MKAFTYWCSMTAFKGSGGGRNSSQEFALLAHVMAHEIAHMLQGISRHSETGIMKPKWSSAEMRELYYKPLSFEPQDIKLIELGLRKRQNVAANRRVSPGNAMRP